MGKRGRRRSRRRAYRVGGRSQRVNLFRSTLLLGQCALTRFSCRSPLAAFDSYPDGGFAAWLQIFCCFNLFFTTVGGIYACEATSAASFPTRLTGNRSGAGSADSSCAHLQGVFSRTLCSKKESVAAQHCPSSAACRFGVRGIRTALLRRSDSLRLLCRCRPPFKLCARFRSLA